ncbi:MAG: hypothetical protein IMW91_02700 [Firmicutes bacterium]|nr:hypothetical protein [Bacillota bacterium]
MWQVQWFKMAVSVATMASVLAACGPSATRMPIPQQAGVSQTLPQQSPGTVATPPPTATGIPPGLLSFATLQQYNPKLTYASQQNSTWEPKTGYRFGAGASGLHIMTDGQGYILGFQAVFPKETAWQPWFDQPKGEQDASMGRYTQRLYVVDPHTLPQNGPGMAGYNGAPPNRPTPYGGATAILPQVQQEKGKNQPSAPSPSGTDTNREPLPGGGPYTFALTWNDLLRFNPKLGNANYHILPDGKNRDGQRVLMLGPSGPGIRILTDSGSQRRFVGLLLSMPAKEWNIALDQPKGQPGDDGSIGHNVYTQTLFLYDPNALGVGGRGSMRQTQPGGNALFPPPGLPSPGGMNAPAAPTPSAIPTPPGNNVVR